MFIMTASRDEGMIERLDTPADMVFIDVVADEACWRNATAGSNANKNRIPNAARGIASLP